MSVLGEGLEVVSISADEQVAGSGEEELYINLLKNRLYVNYTYTYTIIHFLPSRESAL